MNTSANQKNEKLLQLIQDPQLCAARESVAIKQNVLFDYLRPPEMHAAYFEAFAETFAEDARKFLRPDDPLVFRERDGDISLAQPYAEMFVLSGARHFGGALALILMAETCYEPSLGDPARLNEALARYRPLVKGGALVSAELLHEFLEVNDSPSHWLAGHFRRHRMIPGRDYVRVPESGTYYRDDSMMPILFRPEVVAKVAVTTPTLRGRKMKACLVEPRVRPFDLADNDPALLQLLFTPPARGLSSL